MRRQVIDADGFETKFRLDIDPWDYAGSPFEAHKRRVLLRACGARARGRGLEIACAIGVNTEALAPRCLRLLAVDSSETALAEAALRTAAHRNVTLRRSRLPDEIPAGRFDLIVASEILYYLRERACRQVVAALADALAPGGRMVVLHHAIDFDDAAQRPRQAQRRTENLLRRTMQAAFVHQERRFRAVAFEKRR